MKRHTPGIGGVESRPGSSASIVVRTTRERPTTEHKLDDVWLSALDDFRRHRGERVRYLEPHGTRVECGVIARVDHKYVHVVYDGGHTALPTCPLNLALVTVDVSQRPRTRSVRFDGQSRSRPRSES